MVESEDRIIEAKPLSIDTKLEIELGKKLIYDSLTSVNDYAKYMIGFNGVLAGLYSGLVKILPKESIQNIHSVMLFLPVLFFVSSATIFTIAYFPRMKHISISQPSSVLKAYKELAEGKMRMSLLGTCIFILSILILALTLIFVIK